MLDDEIRKIADRSLNFGYLYDHEKLLVVDGAFAESSVYTDPDNTLVKARRFTETLAKLLLRRLGMPIADDQFSRIRRLADAGLLNQATADAFHEVRRSGNQAAHTHWGERAAALRCVRLCFELGQFVHLAFTPGETTRRAFAPPQPPANATAADGEDAVELSRLTDEVDRLKERHAQMLVRLDEKIGLIEAEQAARRQADAELAKALADRDRLSELVAGLQAHEAELLARLDANLRSIAKPNAGAREQLITRAETAARPVRTEREVRDEVDRMLRDAGWVIQEARALNLYAARGIAVIEGRTASGPADYLLYVDQTLVGVVEAKREGTSLHAVERQTARYAKSLTAAQQLAAWGPPSGAGRGPLPFRYETTSVETHFTNTLDPDARSRPVFGFHRPETFAKWMRAAEESPELPTLRARLRDGLPALDDDRLRPAQRDAVEGLERSLSMGRPRALIQMATGAGKTYTAVSSTYRLLKHGGANRVLFLVDRNNLGEQAEREFENYLTPGDGRKFSELYNVQRLARADMLESSSVVISTVQRLYSLLKGRPLPAVDAEDEILDSYDRDDVVSLAYNATIPPESFDMIVVDECHRSIYGLWRAVLEYFDAFIVGLTATPVAQTIGFFQQNLVSQYTYRQAVADGVNVDFNVYRIRTEIGENGAVIPEGIVVPRRDRRTRAQRYEELDDDFGYRRADLGRRVVSKGQLRLVIETFRERLFTEIFAPEPGRPERSTVPKTLIFAVDDNHAEEIVGVVREVFGKGNEFCQKITYSVKNSGALIQEFRNSPDLRIAVTVNMIATGTDIRPLECVFFLNEVKSWAMFEQMKGRGARSVDSVELRSVTPDVDTKDRFILVDAVGVTDSDRVDASPLEKHTEKQISFEKLLKKAGTLTLSLSEAATLGSRIARLDTKITAEERDELETVAGHTLKEVVHRLARCDDDDVVVEAMDRGGRWEHELVKQACEYLANPDFRQKLLTIRRTHDITYDEVNVDNLLEAKGRERGVVDEVVLERWQEMLENRRDEMIALEAVYRSGKDPKRAYRELKALTADIARPPRQWTPEILWKAYERAGRAAARPGMLHGPADLIALIRVELGLADGEPVLAAHEAVRAAFNNWLARQHQAGVRFSEGQLWWLHGIVDIAATSAGFDPAELDGVRFSERGGTDGFLREFGESEAVRVLDELGGELTA